MSTVDDYYKWTRVEFQGRADAYGVVGYVGATRTFTLNSSYYPGGSFPLGPGINFTIKPGGRTGDPTDGPGAAPSLNPLVAPAYAWAYWHRRAILGDLDGSLVHRTRHDAMFDGQVMAHHKLFAQKDWNQALLWTTDGLAWRAAGDAIPDEGDPPPDPDPEEPGIYVIPHPSGGVAGFFRVEAP